MLEVFWNWLTLQDKKKKYYNINWTTKLKRNWARILVIKSSFQKAHCSTRKLQQWKYLCSKCGKFGFRHIIIKDLHLGNALVSFPKGRLSCSLHVNRVNQKHIRIWDFLLGSCSKLTCIFFVFKSNLTDIFLVFFFFFFF